MFDNIHARRTGRHDAPPARIPLRAGRLTLTYEAGSLQEIAIADKVIVRRLYVAIRGADWSTVPAVLSDVNITQGDDSFEITFTSTHRQDDIHFAWRGALTGTADDRIVFRCDGEALSDFATNRVGVCTLFPRENAGAAALLTHTDGRDEPSGFPDLILNETVFYDLRAVTTTPVPGVTARVLLEGDQFETEDQRNWSDASFKTYNTANQMEKPWRFTTGQRFTHTVTVTLDGAWSLPTHDEQHHDPAVVTLTPGTAVTLPAIGTVVRADAPLTPDEAARLARLDLAHVRVDLRADGGLQDQLSAAWATATALHADLELGLHFGTDFDAGLRALLDALNIIPMHGRILVFRDGENPTRAETVALVREAVGTSGAVRVGGGTSGHFVDLNGSRETVARMALASCTLSPLVHAIDNQTMIEMLTTIADITATAHSFAPDTALALSPVTLRQGWMPLDAAVGPNRADDGLPARVDPRQASLFGAGWTLGLIAAAARAGVSSLTLYEGVGWRGLTETAAGSAMPGQFPSVPGGAFPIWHVIADVHRLVKADRAAAHLVPLDADHPFRVAALAVMVNGAPVILAANLTAEPITVAIGGIDAAGWTVRYLDDETIADAAREPDAFTEAGSALAVGADGLRVRLRPYGLVRLIGG